MELVNILKGDFMKKKVKTIIKEHVSSILGTALLGLGLYWAAYAGAKQGTSEGIRETTDSVIGWFDKHIEKSPISESETISTEGEA